MLQRKTREAGGYHRKAVGYLWAKGEGTGAGAEGPVFEHQPEMQAAVTTDSIEDFLRKTDLKAFKMVNSYQAKEHQ